MNKFLSHKTWQCRSWC